MMKVLKSLWFLLLAALVLAAFAYPFSAVPKRFEDRAREMTLERVEEGGASVDERYIEQSVREAVGNNLGVIFRTAFIIAAFSALLVYCVSIRPPHDCGGFNLFNPIYLPLVFVIAVLTGLTLSSVLKARGGAAVNDFYALTSSLPGVFPEGKWAFLPPMLFIVLAFELIFRGVVFSFLEKIHFFGRARARARHICAGGVVRGERGGGADLRQRRRGELRGDVHRRGRGRRIPPLSARALRG